MAWGPPGGHRRGRRVKSSIGLKKLKKQKTYAIAIKDSAPRRAGTCRCNGRPCAGSARLLLWCGCGVAAAAAAAAGGAAGAAGGGAAAIVVGAPVSLSSA